MLTDYKFWFIRRDDAGFITEVAVRFYKGEMQIVDGSLKYVRTTRIIPDEQSARPKLTEVSGQQSVVFYPSDFGAIKTDNELIAFLNKELGKNHA